MARYHLQTIDPSSNKSNKSQDSLVCVMQERSRDSLSKASSLHSEPSDQLRMAQSEMSSLKESSFKDEDDMHKIAYLAVRNDVKKNKDDLQILKTLLLINVAATVSVMLVLIGFGATWLATRNNTDTCDCECLYEFPPQTPPPTFETSTAAGIPSNQSEDVLAEETSLGPSSLPSLSPSSPPVSYPPTVIRPQSSLADSQQLSQAVQDAEEAGYDPSAPVFAEYGYPMGLW